MSTLLFASYGMFIYTQRPVLNGFYVFPILMAQFVLYSKNLTERSEWLAESGNEADTQADYLSFCIFISKYRDSFTIYMYRKPSS